MTGSIQTCQLQLRGQTVQRLITDQVNIRHLHHYRSEITVYLVSFILGSSSLVRPSQTNRGWAAIDNIN